MAHHGTLVYIKNHIYPEASSLSTKMPRFCWGKKVTGNFKAQQGSSQPEKCQGSHPFSPGPFFDRPRHFLPCSVDVSWVHFDQEDCVVYITGGAWHVFVQ